MVSTGRVYGGVTAEQRHAERRRKVIDACLDLLGDRPVSDLTVGDVCAKAGLSKRYFYEHFDTLDSLVDAVMDEAVTVLTAAVFTDRAAVTDDLPRDRLASFVDAITSDPRLARIVFVETFGSGSLSRHRHRLVHQSVTLILDDFLAPERSRIDDETARVLTAYSLAGATSELLVAWTEGELDASAEQLIDHLATLFERMASSG